MIRGDVQHVDRAFDTQDITDAGLVYLCMGFDGSLSHKSHSRVVVLVPVSLGCFSWVRLVPC